MSGVLEEKSLKFAIRIVNLYKYLIDEKKEFVMSKQVLRSGTSIGANIAEAQYAQSKADFLTKMHISLKEASETKFWLKLLYSTSYINDSHTSIMNDCDELLKILTSTCKTTKQQ
jgi:four helix bundle protein